MELPTQFIDTEKDGRAGFLQGVGREHCDKSGVDRWGEILGRLQYAGAAAVGDLDPIFPLEYPQGSSDRGPTDLELRGQFALTRKVIDPTARLYAVSKDGKGLGEERGPFWHAIRGGLGWLGHRSVDFQEQQCRNDQALPLSRRQVVTQTIH